MNADLIQTIAVYALPVLFAITLHEAAHGYVAKHFGDPTAFLMGRVTLNPLKHIDPIGTILVPLALYFMTSGAFLFGYAKPVPVAFGSLRNPRVDTIWVALAGPLCNFAQAILWALLGVGLQIAGVREPFFMMMAQAGLVVNLVMCMFNLFPVPPLDGGRVLVSLLPARAAYTLSRIEPYGFFIVMALVVSGVLGRVWLWPLIQWGRDVIVWMLTPLLSLAS
ncbi:peptidase M50 [Pandoraea aquatica]|uniref:Peptidase M50 n=1 Tax=Pandoraea aquatica TaxID=2508290 RepID=A0A5E4WHX2_9BURK|nr:site-2 protease family protein [Pandoraea aquatica]VVE22676.1 peptidase M50 [Pandoraea aquatica]